MAKIFKKANIKNVVFLGTPDFAVPSFERLCTSKYKPVLVVTQPDKPKGRKKQLQATPVKISALENGVPVLQPPNINSEDVLEEIRLLSPDIIITVAYGGYLGKKLRKMAPLGCINLHPSLLPKYRGASPLQSTMFDNLDQSGISIFKIVAAMDAGPILLQKKFPIKKETIFTEYSEMMSHRGADLLIELLESIEQEGLEAIPQDHEQATFTRKIEKEDLLINWKDDIVDNLGKIRGLSYIPGAKTVRNGKWLKILRASVHSNKQHQDLGKIIDVIKNVGFVVSCNGGELLVTEVQAEGKKVMSAHAYNLGNKLGIGEILG